MKVKELLDRLQQAEPEAEIDIVFLEDGYQEVSGDIVEVKEYYNTAHGYILELRTFPEGI